MKKHSITKSLLMTGGAVAMIAPAVVQPVQLLAEEVEVQDAITIEDKVLEQKLLSQLKRVSGMSKATVEDLTPENLAKIEVLTLTEPVTNLEPLQYLTNLTELTIRNSPELTSIDSISGLNKLMMLSVRSTPSLSNVPDLSGMTALKYVYVSDTAIENVDFLKDNAEIVDLELSKNPLLTNTSGLTENKDSLKELNISQTPIDDVMFVSAMPSLQILYIHNTKIHDLSPLANTSLTKLHLNNTPVSDMSPLESLPLSYLSLDGTKVTDFAFLNSLSSLTLLNLANLNLDEIPNLDGNPQLDWLGLKDNNIKDLSPLKTKESLVNLYFPNNRVEDVTSLTEMPWLEEIDMSENLVHSLDGFENLTALYYLDAYDNLIAGEVPESIKAIGSWGVDLEYNFLKDTDTFGEQMVLLPNEVDNEEKTVGEMFQVTMDYDTTDNQPYDNAPFKGKFKPSIHLISGEAEVKAVSFDTLEVTPLSDKEPIVFEAVVSGDVKNTFTYQVKKGEVTPPVEPEPEEEPEPQTPVEPVEEEQTGEEPGDEVDVPDNPDEEEPVIEEPETPIGTPIPPVEADEDEDEEGEIVTPPTQEEPPASEEPSNDANEEVKPEPTEEPVEDEPIGEVEVVDDGIISGVPEGNIEKPVKQVEISPGETTEPITYAPVKVEEKKVKETEEPEDTKDGLSVERLPQTGEQPIAKWFTFAGVLLTLIGGLLTRSKRKSKQ
ncbi:leucine-rich repeat domain-containing protein [Rossellomorea marisflavi]|uniref:leucine-rich repeat domain-containing protein n=1 Tax=Rossellomorea marisflavi TaxID=189381 RepID=UPI003FA174C1